MKNVLFITPDFYPSSTGFANASLNLIKAIKEHGANDYNIHVFTDVPIGEEPELNGIIVYRYKNLKGSILKFGSILTFVFRQYLKYKAIKKIVIEHNIDVIFFETNTFPFLQNWVVKDFKEKVFVRIHSTADTEIPVFYGTKKWYKPRIVNKRYFSFMEEVPNILSTSNYYIEFIKKEFFKGNPYKIWNGKTYGLLFNTAGITNFPEISPIENNTFLTMGKLSDNGFTQKGFIDLLRAVYFLKEKNGLPEDFLLKMVGNGDKLETIRRYISKLGIENNIEIIEKASHEEVFKLIEASKAIILLSRYEGQSMFITESLAIGKPIILSDHNGMHEMLRTGENGFLVKTGDPQSVSDVIEDFFKFGHDKLKCMSEASRKLYIEKFSSEAVYKQFNNSIKLRY